MNKKKMLLFGGIVILQMIPNVSDAASDNIVDVVGSVCYDEDFDGMDGEVPELYRVVHCPIDVYKSIYDDNQYSDNYGSFVEWADEYFGDALGTCPETVDDMPQYDSEGNSNRCYVDVTDRYVAVCARVGEDDDACSGCRLPSVGDLVYNEWLGFDENDTLSRRKKIKFLETFGDVAYETNWQCNAYIEMEYEYACNVGYYTKNTNLTSASQCDRCPQIGGVYGTSPVGNMSITNCCIGPGIKANDGTGVFEFDTECCYTE